jgi:hypothetical protein
MNLDSPQPPGDTFVRGRWIPQHRVDWARACDRIMLEHGRVIGSRVYPKRHLARWRAQSLIRLLVELRMHERWEVTEHVGRRDGGWTWSVEYVGRRGR